MQLSVLSKAKERFNSPEFDEAKKESLGIRKALRGVDLSKMDGVIKGGLTAPVNFFATLDRIFSSETPSYDLVKEAEADEEKGFNFKNQLEKDLYDASKAVFEARFSLFVGRSAGTFSSDPNQFIREPKKARDIDERYKPMFDLVEKAHSFAEEEILPYLSSELKTDLEELEELTTSFKVDSISPGEGLKYTIANITI